MPRIPTRTTPYDTPTRQHRHFKNKRDQILRALGRSSYINGSQFAILWVSARGETETYASPALQTLLRPKLGEAGLFGSAILNKAKEAASKAPTEASGSEICLDQIKKPPHASWQNDGLTNDKVTRKRKIRSKPSEAARGRSEVEPESHVTLENHSIGDLNKSIPSSCGTWAPMPKSSVSSACSRSKYPSFTVSGESLNYQAQESWHLDINMRSGQTQDLSLAQAGTPKATPSLSDAQGTGAEASRPVEEPFQNKGVAPHAKLLLSQHQNSHPPEPKLSSDCRNPEGERIARPLPSRATCENPPSDVVNFTTPESICAFLGHKFSQLQQKTCRLVCKAWIKVIEPKKQTKFPYLNGEAQKPDWWPADVIHREPDHLMKNERMRLMLAVLGAGKVSVGRLELASAESAVHITPDKMAILEDIYRVAKEEERLRVTWPSWFFSGPLIECSSLLLIQVSEDGGFVPFTVELSRKPSDTFMPIKASASATKFVNTYNMEPAENPPNQLGTTHPPLSSRPSITRVDSSTIYYPLRSPSELTKRIALGVNPIDNSAKPPGGASMATTTITPAETGPLSDHLPNWRGYLEVGLNHLAIPQSPSTAVSQLSYQANRLGLNKENKCDLQRPDEESLNLEKRMSQVTTPTTVCDWASSKTDNVSSASILTYGDQTSLSDINLTAQSGPSQGLQDDTTESHEEFPAFMCQTQAPNVHFRSNPVEALSAFSDLRYPTSSFDNDLITSHFSFNPLILSDQGQNSSARIAEGDVDSLESTRNPIYHVAPNFNAPLLEHNYLGLDLGHQFQKP